MDENNPAEQFKIETLAERWQGPLVLRVQDVLDEFSGKDVLNARTLANEDSLGTGPKVKLNFGRKVAYPVESLIEWMKIKLEEGDVYSSMASTMSDNRSDKGKDASDPKHQPTPDGEDKGGATP